MGNKEGIVKISGDFQLIEIPEDREQAECERILTTEDGEYLTGVYVNLGVVLDVIRSGKGEVELASLIDRCSCSCNSACLKSCTTACKTAGAPSSCKSICKNTCFGGSGIKAK